MHEFLQLEQILTVLTDFLEFITNLLLMKTGLLLHIAILKVYFLELMTLDLAVHKQYLRLLVFFFGMGGSRFLGNIFTACKISIIVVIVLFGTLVDVWFLGFWVV